MFVHVHVKVYTCGKYCYESVVFTVECLASPLLKCVTTAHGKTRWKRQQLSTCHSATRPVPATVQHNPLTHTHTQASGLITDVPSSSLFLGQSACGLLCWLGNASQAQLSKMNEALTCSSIFHGFHLLSYLPAKIFLDVPILNNVLKQRLRLSVCYQTEHAVLG